MLVPWAPQPQPHPSVNVVTNAPLVLCIPVNSHRLPAHTHKMLVARQAHALLVSTALLVLQDPAHALSATTVKLQLKTSVPTLAQLASTEKRSN